MTTAAAIAQPPVPIRGGLARFARRNPTIVIGGAMLLLMVCIAVLAPWISGDPFTVSPADRLRPPSFSDFFASGKIDRFGTDNLGRDIFARTVHGTRISLMVGISVALLATLIGLGIGLVAGYFRLVDAIVMRVMDALMAIPSILLAIALVALTGGGIAIVIAAITVPDIPRVVRLVRSVVLTVRERPYIDAAVSVGSPSRKIILRHILPSTIGPLIVQATYICASAILVEAGLSFLGAGVPPEIPTWGNMIAQSRLFLARAPWTIFAPGICLALVVLSINLLGDGLRDRLDPRLARRM
ncbi:ABC transporter permease [Elioraea sp. Yellowstone]|jgi:peptide/nickel transport system permease protein|uniref:ABC transporter permease n=1 Tax=Elioraea sp. Yellowstone TaxID=2592070 RepID=UPI001152EDFA|nr:ABC transporter permease [Elioraea sp. Yellowstone]TQF85662.1 ABC transporter permease [Elioraea sp. Yellowstone]